MQCYVYRATRRADTYVYFPEKDDFSDLPEGVMRALGTLEFALEFDLTPERTLAQEDPQKVLANLKEQGFHLQFPPPEDKPES
ncbi:MULTISPECIES: YcgL domain-containing protein [unclassified Thioalkalivibrio]|uniref:YcgL domain-containing protein n=1 Tax=unclassified Thioalkalivibrio TaxID=2621013 RepID=UPI00035D68CF|nr:MULTISPECIES: YcgL domain-containing protein [unclassified Thioalkalivibrio]